MPVTEEMKPKNDLRHCVENSNGASENGTMTLSHEEHLANDYPIPELLMSEMKVYSMCLVCSVLY